MTTTHIPVMQVVFELVQQAEATGIPIGTTSTYGNADYISIGIHAQDDADAPRLAALLGLTDRRVQSYDDESDLETWTGTVGIANVRTSRTIPAMQAAAS